MQIVLKRANKKWFQQQNIYTYTSAKTSSMWERYKNVSLLFHGRAGDVSTIQRTEAKKSENGFLELSYDCLRDSLRETIIYCLNVYMYVRGWELKFTEVCHP